MTTQTTNGKTDGKTGLVATTRPRTDVFESENEIVLVLEMPGTDESSIEVLWTGDVLTVRGTPARETPPEGWRAEWSEFELRPYERSIRVSKPIDRDAIQASIKNGCLRVVLPKLKPRSNRIEVQSA